jgi:hypothetical protein
VLEIFRKNYFINTILLLPYLFLVRLGLFFYHPDIPGQDTQVFRMSMWMGLDEYPVLNIVLTNLLIFAHVLMINYLHIHHKLSRSSSLFAGLFYILWVSISSSGGLSDVLIANTFVILALGSLWQCYKITNITVHVFNAGIFIGFAGLLFSPYAFFLFFAGISVSIISRMRFKDVIQLLISFSIPWFLWFTFHYWNDIPFTLIDVVRHFGFQWSWVHLQGPLTALAGIALYMILFFLSLIWYVDLKSKKSIESQKKIDTLYVFVFIAALVLITYGYYGSALLSILAIPLSFFLAIKAGDSKSSWGFELLHLAFLGIIIISQWKLL